MEALSPSIGLSSLLLCQEHLIFVFHRYTGHLSSQRLLFASRLSNSRRIGCVCHPLMAVMNPLYSGLKPLMMIHLILVSLIRDSESSFEIS
ncbi:hypothetical protein AMTRI_Chr04g246470 [Amborella trichopoda]